MVKYILKVNVQIFESGRVVMYANMSDQNLNILKRLGRGKVHTGILPGIEHKGKNYRILLESD